MSTAAGSKPKTMLAPITIHGKEYADLGYCRTPWGGLNGDGPVIHTVYCRRGDGWGDSAISGSDCIQPGQDGAAIQRARDAARNKRRFTPPEYREGHACAPGPAITIEDHRQRIEILALRGRPRGTDGRWTTWETYDEPRPSDLDGSPQRLIEGPIARTMSASEAAEIIDEFETRLPHYEFTIVTARLVVEEERLA
jgi:hypothetical protein